MKIISWNVNGLRSVLTKDKQGKKTSNINENVLETLIKEQDPDIICLQESRCPCDLKTEFKELPYKFILSSTTKKGYSGVAIFSKEKPIKIHTDFIHNEEGRIIIFEYPQIYIVNAYVPNSKPDLSRLEYRINVWEKEVRDHLNKYQKKKPVIYLGDFNVAATEIDIHNAKANEKNHGYTIEERTAFVNLLDQCKLTDTFRYMHPKDIKYSWFSNFAKSRERGMGWRIDYILISDKLKNKIKNADILSEYFGSDHIPILLEIDI
jgi:exodeoxyribonuclease-3